MSKETSNPEVELLDGKFKISLPFRGTNQFLMLSFRQARVLQQVLNAAINAEIKLKNYLSNS